MGIVDRLEKGRSFARGVEHPSGVPGAVRIFPPENFGEGFEDAYQHRGEMLITTKQITAKRAFEDSEPGLGRIVFLFHLHGRRIIEVPDIGQYKLNFPSFVAYYQAEGVSKISTWSQGDTETAVLIGFWPENPPKVLVQALKHTSERLALFSKDESPFVWVEQPLTYEMEQAAQRIIAPNVSDLLLTEYHRSKANELLCLGFDAVLNSVKRTPASLENIATRIEQARQIIEERLKVSSTVQSLATEVELDPEILSKMFSVKYGCSISEYGVKCRMTKARDLLVSQNIPIKQVAFEVGYNHTSNFCIAFKKYYRITPRQATKRL